MRRRRAEDAPKLGVQAACAIERMARAHDIQEILRL